MAFVHIEHFHPNSRVLYNRGWLGGMGKKSILPPELGQVKGVVCLHYYCGGRHWGGPNKEINSSHFLLL